LPGFIYHLQKQLKNKKKHEKFDDEVLTMVDKARFNVNKLLTNPDWISMVVEEVTISIENTKLI
jgi:hypothetical protein